MNLDEINDICESALALRKSAIDVIIARQKSDRYRGDCHIKIASLNAAITKKIALYREKDKQYKEYAEAIKNETDPF